MSRDLRIRFTVTRPGLVRAALLTAIFGFPGLIESQTDASHSVSMNMSVSTPVGAFGQLMVNGNAVLARYGGVATFGYMGSGTGGAFTTTVTGIGGGAAPSGMVLAGRAVFGQATDVSANRYDNSLNIVATPGGAATAGLAIANRGGGNPWAFTAAPSATRPGVDVLWFNSISGGALTPSFGIDSNGSFLVARWVNGTCNAAAGEFPVFSGVGAADNVSSECDVKSGVALCQMGPWQLCLPFKDGW